MINGIYWAVPHVDAGRELLHLQWANDPQKKNVHRYMNLREVDMILKRVRSFETLAAYRNIDSH